MHTSIKGKINVAYSKLIPFLTPQQYIIDRCEFLLHEVKISQVEALIR